MPSSELKPVIRRRSGLTRSFSWWAAFLFGIHCISLSSSGFIPFSWVSSVWPGASIVGVLSIAVVFCGVHAVTYAIIGTSVSRTGADYVFASRALSPLVAFVASWTLVLFSGIVAGGLAAWVPQSAIPALARPMAIILHNARYNLLADFATSHIGTIAIGWTIVVIAMVTMLRTNIFIQRILGVGFIFGIVAWAIIYFSLLSASGPEVFRQAWNHFMAPFGAVGSYDAQVPLARQAGMHIASSSTTMTMAGLIMGFWIFYGYYIPTFFSEEVRNPGRNLLISSLSSLLVSYLIFAGAAFLLQRLVKLDWIAAEGYLSNNQDRVAAATHNAHVVAMPWITFYAAILKPVPWMIYTVAFAWIFTLINLIQTYFFYSSRIVYSWSLDRVVPDWTIGKPGQVPSPARSILIITCLALVGVVDAAFGGPLGTQLTFVFFAVVTSLVPVFALTFLPILSPQLFQRIPKRFRTELVGIPVSSILGGVTLAYLLWMIVASFLFPAAGVPNPKGTLVLLVVFLVSGTIFFAVMRAYRQRVQGIDIDFTYKGIETIDEKPEWA